MILKVFEDSYGDRVEFLLVYIREANAADSRHPDAKIKINEPVDLKSRNQAAQKCSTMLGLTVPIVADTMDDKTNLEYMAWPRRIYIIAPDGTVAYRNRAGTGIKFELVKKSLDALLDKDD